MMTGRSEPGMTKGTRECARAKAAEQESPDRLGAHPRLMEEGAALRGPPRSLWGRRLSGNVLTRHLPSLVSGCQAATRAVGTDRHSGEEPAPYPQRQPGPLS